MAPQWGVLQGRELLRGALVEAIGRLPLSNPTTRLNPPDPWWGITIDSSVNFPVQASMFTRFPPPSRLPRCPWPCAAVQTVMRDSLPNYCGFLRHHNLLQLPCISVGLIDR